MLTYTQLRLRYGMFWPNRISLKISYRYILLTMLYILLFLASSFVLSKSVSTQTTEERIYQLEAELKFKEEQLLIALNGGYAGLWLYNKHTNKTEYIFTRCDAAESIIVQED